MTDTARDTAMPAEVGGLVERLRRAIDNVRGDATPDAINHIANTATDAASALEALSARNERLRKALKEAADALDAAMEDVEHWGAYAGEYFQDKHDLDGDLARISEQATAARRALEGGE